MLHSYAECYGNPVKYVLYSIALFEQEKPNLKDKGMVSPSSQLSTIPSPFEVVVTDSSNLIVHFFPGISANATSPRISSLSEHFSFPGNWANRSAMAWLLTASGVLRPTSY